MSSQTPLARLAYDAVWALALALNATQDVVSSGSINGTGCEECEGSLVSLELFENSNELMSCLIRNSMSDVKFQGRTVSVCNDIASINNNIIARCVSISGVSWLRCWKTHSIELNLFRHNNDRVTQKVVLYKCSPNI